MQIFSCNPLGLGHLKIRILFYVADEMALGTFMVLQRKASDKDYKTSLIQIVYGDIQGRRKHDIHFVLPKQPQLLLVPSELRKSHS